MQEVVSLIFEKNGLFLAEKRTKDTDAGPNKVTFPAGRVQEKEQKLDALRREIKEELGIEIIDPFFVYKEEFHLTRGNEIVYFYGCKEIKGEPEGLEGQGVLWITDEKELDYDISRRALRAYKDLK